MIFIETRVIMQKSSSLVLLSLCSKISPLFLYGEKYQYSIRNLFLALENNQIHFDKKLIEMHLKSNKVIREKSQLSYRNSSMHMFQNLIQTAALANPRNFLLQAFLKVFAF